jgi:hypothetical protein
VQEPEIVGVLEPDKSAGGSPTRELVIRYTTHFSEHQYAAVPLLPDGTPVPPFGFAGPERKPGSIAHAMPDSQRAELARPCLTLHGDGWAEKLRKNPRYRKLSTAEEDDIAVTDIKYRIMPDGHLEKDPRIRIIAFGIGRPNESGPATSPSLPRGRQDVVEYRPVDLILILPSTQPRPEAARQAAQVQATLLTPLTVLGDAICIPLLFIACYGFGACP